MRKLFISFAALILFLMTAGTCACSGPAPQRPTLPATAEVGRASETPSPASSASGETVGADRTASAGPSSGSATADQGAASPPPQPSVPEDTQHPTATFDGHTYRIYPTRDLGAGTSPEAFCESMGGHLATLTSAEENDFAAGFVTGNGYDNAVFGLIHDSARSPEPYWVTGEPRDFDMLWNGDLTWSSATEAGKEYAVFCFSDLALEGPDAFAGAEGAFLAQDGGAYPADQAIDGDPETAWSEGAPGDGTGESIRVRLAQYYGITSMEIWNGYQKREDLYERNGRPSAITITFDTKDGPRSESFALQDVFGPQTLTMPELVLADGFTITIDSVYPGSEFSDTLISEISLDGVVVDPLWMFIPEEDLRQDMAFLCEWDAQARSVGTGSADAGTERLSFGDVPSDYGVSGRGWGMLITIAADGSFTGSSRAMMSGDQGPDYPNGTDYICEFSGRFSEPVRQSEFVYFFALEDLTFAPPGETMRYGSGSGDFDESGVRYVTDEPLGLGDGKQFQLYLPGCPAAQIPEPVQDWLQPTDSTMSVLPRGTYAIGNLDEGYGWRSIE